MSRTDDDDMIAIGKPFTQLEAVAALDRLAILVTWAGGKQAVVDLAPTIHRFKIYAPLRTDRTLVETVHLVDSFSVAWGDDDAIDMHVSEIERLAGEAMEAADFKRWMAELNLTRDAAAALLGVSRRTIGYYLSGEEIPRYMALACAQVRATRFPPQIAENELAKEMHGLVPEV